MLIHPMYWNGRPCIKPSPHQNLSFFFSEVPRYQQQYRRQDAHRSFTISPSPTDLLPTALPMRSVLCHARYDTDICKCFCFLYFKLVFTSCTVFSQKAAHAHQACEGCTHAYLSHTLQPLPRGHPDSIMSRGGTRNGVCGGFFSVRSIYILKRRSSN